MPQLGGVYAFWWTGNREPLARSNRELILHGRDVHLMIDDDWLGLATGQPIPLYVGKNADSIAARIGKHLRLKDIRMLPLGSDAKKAQRPTTTCQFLAGVEHLFPDKRDTRTFILDDIGLSYVELDEDAHAANRFYLEDLTIGMMHPPFHVDIER